MSIGSYVSKRVFGGVRVVEPDRAKQIRAATLDAMNRKAAGLPGGSAGIETGNGIPAAIHGVSPGHFNSTTEG